VNGCASKWVEWFKTGGTMWRRVCGVGCVARTTEPATARGISICRPDGGSRIDGPRRQSIWQRSDGVVLQQYQTSVRRSLVFGRRAREQLTSYTKLASFGDFGALRTYWSLPCGRSFFCKSSKWTEGEAAVSAGTLPTGRAETFERTLHEASMLWIVIQTVWTLSTASNGSMGRMSDLGGEHASATRYEQRSMRLTTPAAPEHIRADMSVRVAVRMDRRPGKGTANWCQKESGDLTPRRRSKTADALVPARSDDEGHFRRVDRIPAAETKPECKDLSLGV